MGDKDRVMSSRVFGVLFFLTLVLYCAPPAHSQAAVGPQQQPGQAPTEASAAELQKKVQNPVSNLISVPLQSNIDFGIGPYDRTRNTLNIQPAIPLQLSESVNMIVRTIIPVVLAWYTPTPGSMGAGQRSTGRTAGASGPGASAPAAAGSAAPGAEGSGGDLRRKDGPRMTRIGRINADQIRSKKTRCAQ